MIAYKMDTGTFHMAPLDEFVVTVKDFTKKKEKIDWSDWYEQAKFPAYEVVDGYKVVFADCKDPGDIEIQLPFNDPPYELVWAK